MLKVLCLFWVSIAAPMSHAEPYLMNDVGGTLTTPRGWEMTRWSDWDFKAKGANGTIMYKLWLTPYQSVVNAETASSFADEYVRLLSKEGGGEGTVTQTEVKTIGGRDTAISTIVFKGKNGKGSEGVYIGAAFAGNGQMIHSRVIASKRNLKAARSALEETLETFKLSKGPAQVEAGDVVSDAGFTATLPEGWRVPVEAEKSLVVGITSKMWKSDLGKDECWVGIQPPIVGDPSVVFACKKFWDGSPVDEHSFSAIEAEWRTLFFGKAGAELPPGEEIMVGDRTGALFRPRDGENPIRLMVAAFDGGVMAVWLRGRNSDTAAADILMNELAPTVRFTGPDGGQPLVRPDRVVGYYLSHRPGHPLVWGPALLLLVGLVGFSRRAKRSNPYGDLEDEI
jgi:hypothetical protein